MLFALVLLLLFFGISGSKAKKNKSAPTGLLSFLEPLVLFVRDDIVKANIGMNYHKYLPYLLTLFFFILISFFPPNTSVPLNAWEAKAICKLEKGRLLQS